MFKKTILATATAGLIALGALGATTSAASAGGGYGGQGSGSMQFGGPGFSMQFGFGNQNHNYHPQKFCKPVVKKVKWWDRRGRPHWRVVVVGQKCFRPQHNGQWNNGPGWGGGGW